MHYKKGKGKSRKGAIPQKRGGETECCRKRRRKGAGAVQKKQSTKDEICYLYLDTRHESGKRLLLPASHTHTHTLVSLPLARALSYRCSLTLSCLLSLARFRARAHTHGRLLALTLSLAYRDQPSPPAVAKVPAGWKASEFTAYNSGSLVSVLCLWHLKAKFLARSESYQTSVCQVNQFTSCVKSAFNTTSQRHGWKYGFCLASAGNTVFVSFNTTSQRHARTHTHKVHTTKNTVFCFKQSQPDVRIHPPYSSIDDFLFENTVFCFKQYVDYHGHTVFGLIDIRHLFASMDKELLLF